MDRYLGFRLLFELRKRREVGMYFDYQGYRALRRVMSVDALRVFLDRQGYRHVPATSDVKYVADHLRYTGDSRLIRGTQAHFLLLLPFEPLSASFALCCSMLAHLLRKTP